MSSAVVVCGDPERFAIECHVQFETSTPSRNAAGSLWFWIGGATVGNRDVISLPGIVAKELQQTLAWCGRRVEPSLYQADASTVLDTIDQGLYDTPGAELADIQKWARFLICMLPGGHEYIDGWLAVMIEGEHDSMNDRVLYRGKGLPDDREVWLPKGEYQTAVSSFLDWFATRQPPELTPL